MDFQNIIGYVNSGYQILKAEAYSQGQGGVVDGVCFGVNSVGMFVTWDFRIRCHTGSPVVDFNTGHYTENQSKALADYHERLKSKYEDYKYHPFTVPGNVK